jgi:hypothetical protein
VRRFRFTIASLLGAVLFVALAFAALREATEFWDSAVFSVTLVLLLSSVLLAVHRAARRRAFWLGFSLFGGAYLVASLIPAVESRLLTSSGLVYLDSIIPGREGPLLLGHLSINASARNKAVRWVAFSPEGRDNASPRQDAVRLWDVTIGRPLGTPFHTTESFLGIGHSLLALLSAIIGGHLSRRLYVSGHAREDVGDATPTPAGSSSGA